MRSRFTSIIAGSALAVLLSAPALAAPPTVTVDIRCLDRTDASGQILNARVTGTPREVQQVLRELRLELCRPDTFTYTTTPPFTR